MLRASLLVATLALGCASSNFDVAAPTGDAQPNDVSASDTSVFDAGGPEAAVDAKLDAPEAGCPSIPGVVVKPGLCAEVLATGQADPRQILVVGASVFWSNYGPMDGRGELMRLGLDGGGPTVFVGSTDAGWRPKFLANAGLRLFWGDQKQYAETDAFGAVHARSVGGGPQVDGPQTYAPRGLAVEGDSVYWVAWGGKAHAMSTGGGSYKEVSAVGVELGDMASDSNGVVYTRAGNGPGSTQEGRLMAFDLDGKNPREFLSPRPNYPWGIRIAKGTVLWVERGPEGGRNGAVLRTDRAGTGAVLQLCSGLARPRFLTVDATATYAYVTVEGLGEGDGEIRRIRLDSASCEVLVSGLSRPHGLDVRSGPLFWTTGDGKVWRIRTPS